MRAISKNSSLLMFVALAALPASASIAQEQPAEPQQQQQPVGDPEGPPVTVTGEKPVKGPEVRGMISARNDNKIQVTTVDGSKTVVAVGDDTRIKGRGGFLGLGSNKLAANQLMNGLPVTIKTVQAPDGLLASEISLQNKDLRFASMIRNGTDQRFDEQTAATEALRNRVADIDQYNVKSTTNVNFDTGKAVLTEQAKADLCSAAQAAEGTDNALILVVGYTDSTGNPDFNQTLSEKRAGRVVNYLQQACKWKPYRMLSPTGMSEADPLADNTTPEGKAQNRRVAVNVLVSKAADGL